LPKFGIKLILLARGWKEPQRHRGHKDRTILC